MRTALLSCLLLMLLPIPLPGGAAAEPPEPRPQDAPLAARMSNEDSASEYWDLSARFDSGHALVARFLITNEGPGQHTAAAVGHLLFPDGTHATFHNGRAKGKWKLKQDGLFLDIGSSELGLAGPSRSYEVDKNSTGVKVFLRIQASPEASVANARGPGGYGVRIVDVAAPIEGTVWIRDRDMPEPVTVRGRAALTQTWMDAAESKVALRRIDFATLGEDASLTLVDMASPDGKGFRWLAVEQAGRIVHATDDFEISLAGEAPGTKGSRYPVPATLKLRGSSLDGSVELQRILLRRDPFEHLPQPFRFLLSLNTRPRRVWAESPFEVKFDPGSDRSALEIRGTGIATVTWLNPPGS